MVYEHDDDEELEVKEVFILPFSAVIFIIIMLSLIYAGIRFFG